jgi:hypothetical protein
MATGSLPGVKRPGRGVDHHPPSSAEVKERVELYLYSTSGPSWPVLGCCIYVTLTSVTNYNNGNVATRSELSGSARRHSMSPVALAYVHGVALQVSALTSGRLASVLKGLQAFVYLTTSVAQTI